MGKLGGRSRQWLLDGLSNEYKPIPEYGLRIILAFSPRTSFLVPLDRCVQFAAAAIGLGMLNVQAVLAMACLMVDTSQFHIYNNHQCCLQPRLIISSTTPFVSYTSACPLY
jgi:membrane-anchored protein YejM (alkaline phosphatase superfamily)